MLLIGLLLLIVAVVFGADMVWENTFHISGVTAAHGPQNGPVSGSRRASP